MSSAIIENLLRFATAEPDDEEMAVRQKEIRLGLLNLLPDFRAGRAAEARAALRNVLARRRLVLGTEDEARIDACADLAALERWLGQAVDAPTAAEALR